jgi:hypothetical protein
LVIWFHIRGHIFSAPAEIASNDKHSDGRYLYEFPTFPILNITPSGQRDSISQFVFINARHPSALQISQQKHTMEKMNPEISAVPIHITFADEPSTSSRRISIEQPKPLYLVVTHPDFADDTSSMAPSSPGGRSAIAPSAPGSPLLPQEGPIAHISSSSRNPADLFRSPTYRSVASLPPYSKNDTNYHDLETGQRRKSRWVITAYGWRIWGAIVFVIIIVIVTIVVALTTTGQNGGPNS